MIKPGDNECGQCGGSGLVYIPSLDEGEVYREHCDMCFGKGYINHSDLEVA